MAPEIDLKYNRIMIYVPHRNAQRESSLDDKKCTLTEGVFAFADVMDVSRFRKVLCSMIRGYIKNFNNSNNGWMEICVIMREMLDYWLLLKKE
jgi:hypothetical protein